MQNQTEEIINLNRTKMVDGLKKLQEQNIITENEKSQLSQRLNQDLDHYLQHQDIDADGIDKMFLASVKSFENIKINQAVFLVISEAYYAIASQRMMKDFPKIEMAIQTNTANTRRNWFEKYQKTEDKFADLILQIQREKKLAFHKAVTNEDFDDIIALVTKIKNDSTLTNATIKKDLIDGMEKYADKEDTAKSQIFNFYYGIAYIKNIEIINEINIYQNKNRKKPEPPSYIKLKSQTAGRFKVLLDEGMITAEQHNFITQMMLQDIARFEANAAMDKDKAKERLLNILAKLKDEELDTEDREAISEIYFQLSQKAGVDINNNLNKWLYDF